MVALAPGEGRGSLERITVAGATVVAAADHLPLADRSADLVTCLGVLGHLPSHRPVVREMARITAGRCIVSVPWDPWHRMSGVVRGEDLRRLGRSPGQVESFTPKALVRALRRGFRDVELHPDLPWLVAECRGPRR